MNEDKELKLMLIEMMKWFHEFCCKNNLRYYALYGTMLGIARHKGFIPWDDDIDVGMPRKDYEKLADLMKKHKEKKYILETPNTNSKDYYYAFSKLYNTNTTLIENTKYKIKRGIYLDIFPLDGVGNNLDESKNYIKEIYKLNTFLLLKTTGFRKGRSLYKNLGVLLFRFIPINPKKILLKLTKKCSNRDYDNYLWISDLTSVECVNGMMPKKYLGIPTLYKFENIEIFGVENPNDYLSKIYGDWKKLPPKEKRVTHHDYIECNLHKTYLEKD